MIDNHELELKAVELFREGKFKEAMKAQDEFLEAVKNSGEDICTCPVKCRFHGKYVECVVIHRGHGNHLPHCFRNMVNQRIDLLSALTEHSVKRQPNGVQSAERRQPPPQGSGA